MYLYFSKLLPHRKPDLMVFTISPAHGGYTHHRRYLLILSLARDIPTSKFFFLFERDGETTAEQVQSGEENRTEVRDRTGTRHILTGRHHQSHPGVRDVLAWIEKHNNRPLQDPTSTSSVMPVNGTGPIPQEQAALSSKHRGSSDPYMYLEAKDPAEPWGV